MEEFFCQIASNSLSSVCLWCVFTVPKQNLVMQFDKHDLFSGQAFAKSLSVMLSWSFDFAQVRI